MADARDRERHLLCAARRDCMAAATQGLPAVADTAGSPASGTTACSSGSTMRWSHSTASEPGGTPRQAQPSSTARASRLPRAADRAAMMQARRSKVASAMLWSILTAGHCLASRTPPMFRIVMAAARCCKSRAASSHSSKGLGRWRLQSRPRHPSDQHHRRNHQQDRRTVRLRGSATALGRRTLLRMDQPKPASGQGRRSHPQIHSSLPLRCRRHAHDPPIGTLRMTFETDSEAIWRR